MLHPTWASSPGHYPAMGAAALREPHLLASAGVVHTPAWAFVVVSRGRVGSGGDGVGETAATNAAWPSNMDEGLVARSILELPTSYPGE